MSLRYKGAILSATPPTTSLSGASGAWTLQQQMQAQAGSTWPYGGPNYIEDVFSTYLYTGNGSTQTITNGINLSGYGGLVWLKGRSAATDHALYDTARGATFDIVSNNTTAQTTQSSGLTSFSFTGFSIGSLAKLNTNAATYVSWAFRKQPKFFDVVTYTGTGANRTIAHNLGSVPGCIIVKRTDLAADWQVYHRSLANTEYMVLNTAAAKATGATRWNSTTPTSTAFSLGTDATVNANGGTYIAYVFAHDAGGFGANGTDNVISCGSFTTDASGNATVTLGYEPQWFLIKDIGANNNSWYVVDSMRGMTANQNSNILLPNSSGIEQASASFIAPTATGFTVGPNVLGASVQTGIYIAIRRGPMKVPTTGTSVFSPVLWTGDNGASRVLSGIGFPPDFANLIRRPGNNPGSGFYDRLRGAPVLITSSYQTESYWANTDTNMGAYGQNSLTLPTNPAQWNANVVTYVGEFFRRAPGFMDVVCYTGTGTNTTQAHNLGVAPELMIVKGRYFATDWQVYSSALANTEYLVLNTTSAKDTRATNWNSTTPTSSVFSLGTATEVNYSGIDYVAYLFASCPGVSKVGSYTGTGATQTIDCGFTGGARFVLIKRTDSTGDWYVWDTARGMVSGTDPSLLLNSTAGEVNANSVYTTSVGFQIVSTAAGINASGGTYIFLAIA